MENKVKTGLFVLLFGVLFLPIMQKNMRFLKDGGPLHGYYDEAPNVAFSLKGWFDGDFQTAKSKYFNDHVGYRPFLLKLHSQINYSLFRKLDYGGTTLGTDNYLYYDNYIAAYYGRDYAGYKPLKERMLKIKALQDTLARCGKTLLLVYSPCKAWFYPEHIPELMKYPHSPYNNYKTCVAIGDSLGVNQADLNKWYLTLKDTSKEILYSRQGIHWSNYGSILGSDSLIRQIERLRHIRMAHPHWLKAAHTTEAKDPDNDMANILNLLYPIAKETFCYPELYYTNDSNTTKPRLIFIGDSYSINLIKTGVMQNISSEWQFWFGFKHVLNKDNYNDPQYIKMENYDWKSELQKADCIVILNTPKNADMLSGGFIEAAYDFYYPKK
jgi:SGNH hydrolase-like domain, acetyltransferase AlgX